MSIRLDIKSLRHYLKINQSEFSEKLDVSQPYLSDLERGRRDINQELISRIESIYGSNVVNMFTEDILDEQKDYDIAKEVEFLKEKNKLLEETVSSQRETIEVQRKLIETLRGK